MQSKKSIPIPKNVFIQFDEEKNKVKSNIIKKNNKKWWWQCISNPNHKWQETAFKRINNLNKDPKDCPICKYF